MLCLQQIPIYSNFVIVFKLEIHFFLTVCNYKWLLINLHTGWLCMDEACYKVEVQLLHKQGKLEIVFLV